MSLFTASVEPCAARRARRGLAVLAAAAVAATPAACEPNASANASTSATTNAPTTANPPPAAPAPTAAPAAAPATAAAPAPPPASSAGPAPSAPPPHAASTPHAEVPAMPACSARLSTTALPRDATAAIQGHSPITALALSTSWLLVGRADGEACLWPSAPAPPHSPARRLVGHRGAILAAALTPDRARAMTAGADGTVRCWDTRTGAQAYSLELGDPSPRRARFQPPEGGSRRMVLGLDVSPRGDLLATAGWDGRVRLWRVSSGEPAGPPIVSARSAARFARFSPAGDLLLVGFDTLTLRAYATSDGAPRGMFDGHLGPPMDGVFVPLGGAPAPGRTGFASLDDYPMLQIWDVAARESVRKYTAETARWFRTTKAAPYTALAALPPATGGPAALALARGGDVLLVSLDAPRSTRPKRLHRGHQGIIRHVAAAGGGLASGDDQGRVVVWTLGPHRHRGER